jgi:hypothetical protein
MAERTLGGHMESFVELTNFIVSLSENPEQARQFREDPNAVIEAAELSEETTRLLLSPPEEFLGEVFARRRRRPRPPAPVVQTQTIVQTHVSTNTNTQVTTHILVAVL